MHASIDIRHNELKREGLGDSFDYGEPSVDSAELSPRLVKFRQ